MRGDDQEWPKADLAGWSVGAAGLDVVVAQLVARAESAVQADFGGIAVPGPDGRLDSIGATNSVVLQADQLQYELSEGPCVGATSALPIAFSPDMGRDMRWPRWGPAVAALGLRCVLCARLVTGDRTLGFLSLYGTHATHFGAPDAALAHLLAADATAVLIGETQRSQSAADDGTTVGRAQGVLMERFHLGPDDASSVMHRYARTTNQDQGRIARLLATVSRAEIDDIPGPAHRAALAAAQAAERASSVNRRLAQLRQQTRPAAEYVIAAHHAAAAAKQRAAAASERAAERGLRVTERTGVTPRLARQLRHAERRPLNSFRPHPPDHG